MTTSSAMNYPDIINLNHFGPNAATAMGVNNLEVDQPGEAALGVSYGVTPDFA